MKLTPKQAAVIEAIELGHTAICEMKEHLGISTNAVFAVIKRLRSKGVIKIVPGGKDSSARYRYIYTGKGYTVEEFFKPENKGKFIRKVEPEPEYPALDAFLSLPARAA